MPERMAVGFAQDALEYLNAANEIDLVKDRGFRLIPPLYSLICHAVELTLKSYLLSSGLGETEMKRIGHDLQRALARSTEFGFHAASDRFKQLVQMLAPYHREHAFRYRRLGAFEYPDAAEAIGIIQPVLLDVTAIVRARAMGVGAAVSLSEMGLARASEG